MNLIKFEDYIGTYADIVSQDWITIYEHGNETINGIRNDVFTFCALIANNDRYIRNHLQNFEWGFSPNSFGHSFFEQVSHNIGNGQFEDEIHFVIGNKKEDFEYLVAHRFFNKKYVTQFDINPKLIWYNNLVKVGNNYVDPINDEIMIRTSQNRVEVLTRYLRDFLAAHNKVCVVVFDHRRFLHTEDKYSNIQKVFSNADYYLLYSLNTRDYDDYNVSSSIIGKSIIRPYTECQHNSLKFLIEEDEFEDFIYDVDRETGKLKVYTCDENKLANYFGANPEAPHFLTPVFFNKAVLNKYKTDTANYIISDGLIRYLDEWDIPFTINEEDKVVVWLGDLGRIPYAEQKYWRTENIVPQGDIEENFWKQQIEAVFVDKILPEKGIFTLIETVNRKFLDKYNIVLFNPLSEADKSIISAFLTPVANNIDEYKEYLMQFCKITVESINRAAVRMYVNDDKLKDAQGQTLASIGQLNVLFKELDISTGDNLISILKLVYNSRNKLSGHSASLKEYNKLWNRKENYFPNWITDSKILISSVNGALNDLIEELK